MRDERKDARLPDVALHLLDEAGIDALADFVFERDARLFLLADDARHERAVHFERVGAHVRAVRDRKFQFAGHRPRVRIGEGKRGAHAAEKGVLLHDTFLRLDRDRLFVRARIDGADDRRRHHGVDDFRDDFLRGGRQSRTANRQGHGDPC